MYNQIDSTSIKDSLLASMAGAYVPPDTIYVSTGGDGIGDYLIIAAGVVSALAAAGAAFISLRANRESKTFNKQQLAWRQVENRSRYYDVIVAAPALEAVSQFRKEAKDLVRKAVEDTEELHYNDAPVGRIRDRVNDLKSRFLEIQISLAVSLTEAAEAWGDEAFREEIRRSAEEIQDNLIPKFYGLIQTPGLDFAPLLNEAAGNVARVVRDRDPIAQEADSSH